LSVGQLVLLPGAAYDPRAVLLRRAPVGISIQVFGEVWRV